MPRGTQMSYAQNLGQARCHSLMKEKFDTKCEILPLIDCWIFTGSKNTDGYGQIFTKKNSDLNLTGRGAQTAFLLHIISFVAAYGSDPGPNSQVSHLCDHRACFNPEHLRAETPQLNNSRKGCPGPIYCPDHYHLLVDLCPHNPRCIRPPRDDARCCLAIREEDPSGWATQSDRLSSSRPNSRADMLVSRPSSEFSGGQFLEQAMRDGLL